MKGLKVSKEIREKTQIHKECGCCHKVFTKLPEDTVHHPLGFWFNCPCKSTLFVRTIKEII